MPNSQRDIDHGFTNLAISLLVVVSIVLATKELTCAEEMKAQPPEMRLQTYAKYFR
jgi:hypothetical protein